MGSRVAHCDAEPCARRAKRVDRGTLRSLLRLAERRRMRRYLKIA